MTDDGKRVAALTDLVECRVSTAAARAALTGFAWDSEEELVTLTPQHVSHVIDRFLGGQMTAGEVEAWAEAVHLRDDLGRPEGSEDAVNEALTEMSSPELFGELEEIAPDLLARLRS